MLDKNVTHIQRGVSENMESGEAQVPTPGGGTQTEYHQDLPHTYLFNGTPASNKLIETLIAKNGLRADAAAAKGQTYAPGFLGRIKGELSTNVTPFRLVVYTAIGISVYYLSKWAAKKLASAMGWNLFGNVVAAPVNEMEVEQPRRAPPPARRPASPAPAPFLPQAAA